ILKTQLEDEFPGDLEITGESTPSTSGWFEVEVNGKLVHSKKVPYQTVELVSSPNKTCVHSMYLKNIVSIKHLLSAGGVRLCGQRAENGNIG
uniref:Uncharacterized protein n=1 Tax=Oncorhynchus kisutch TaxID=8019 RepID=A0A8C7NAQ6_ONCKI